MSPVASAAKRRRPMAEINVVPYIDVMLVLLVIFMITAPLLKSGVDVELPQATAKPIKEQPSEPLVVSVDKAGAYYLNIGDKPDQAISDDQLIATVTAVLRQDAKKQVLVRGDRRVDYGKVVQVMAILQAAGVPQVGLLADQAK